MRVGRIGARGSRPRNALEGACDTRTGRSPARVMGAAFGRRVALAARLAGLAFWRGVVGFYESDNLTYAASIAYYGLLSLFPLLLIGFAVLGRLTADQANRAAVVAFILQSFPSQFDFLTSQLEQFNEHAVSLGVTGSVALVWSALGVFGAISAAVDHAWGVERQRSYWTRKLYAFSMLIVAELILIVAVLLVSASEIARASWFAAVLLRFPGLAVLRSLALRHATTLLFIMVVGLIYYFVPNATVRVPDVWVGAVVTGLLWKATLAGFSWYVRDMSRFTRVNGSIAAVIVFLIWAYVQAVILLYGVEFTAAYARLRRGRPEGLPAAPAPRA